jgi:hypothetical protein
MKQFLHGARNFRVFAGGDDGRWNAAGDLGARDGPERAASLALGALAARMPHMVNPVWCSMPFVTLMRVPEKSARPVVTLRKAFEGTATTTCFCAGQGGGKVGFQLPLGRKLDAGQVTFVGTGAAHVFQVRAVVTPDFHGMTAALEQRGECCAPRACAENGDIHFATSGFRS